MAAWDMCLAYRASFDHAASASPLIDPVPSSSSRRKACMSRASPEVDGCSRPSLSTWGRYGGDGCSWGGDGGSWGGW